MWSAVSAENYDQILKRKGINTLFRESGFKTVVISNQAPNKGLIQYMVEEADSVEWLGCVADIEMVSRLEAVVSEDNSNLFVILHAYGAHYCYNDRYPKEFSIFTPDDNVKISKYQIESLVNSYDNTIVYTDYVISQAIDVLRRSDACSALYYCSDHGEDLFDDSRGRFLHASPTTTYYQLHVASFGWFSPKYKSYFPEQYQAAQTNRDAPATTHAVFHTMAQIASIDSPYVELETSLVSESFDREVQRKYLNDHSLAKPYKQTGLTDGDMAQFAKRGINP